MRKNKEISIITAIYNAKDTINDSINSVLNFKTSAIEYIIIDGGSTDGTVDIVREYLNDIDTFISEPDDGIYDALNKGIRVATGKHILVLGADDEVLNINCAIEYLRDNPDAGALVFDVESYDVATGAICSYKCSVPDVKNIEKSFFDFPLHHQGFICKNYDGLKFDKTLGIHADLQCMLYNIILFGGQKIDVPLSRYRTGGASDFVSFKNLNSFHLVAKNMNVNFFKAVMFNPVNYFKLICKVFLPKQFTLIYRAIKANVLH